ncbi:MAG TPA: alpha/beta fold hydrolase [Acetobacteraceae bacterium]|nr:alpha/beta fold hydrolase [Acetobacteraceae bacterium]
MRSIASLALSLHLLLISACSTAWSADRTTPAPDGPGTLLQQQEIPGAPFGATTYRVLYRSTGMDGRPITVSGLVVVPVGITSPGGRPIVAWAHPTTGVVPRCAPSKALFHFQQIQGLRDMLEHGFIVAATDYPGLGTAEPHPYLVGVSEARAVLDSVRAARQLPGVDASTRFAVWGHSQGGQAALFTGMIAAQYAPELQLVAVAAAAPATDLAALMRADIDTSGGNNLTAMTLWAWSRIYGAPLAKVVTPEAVPEIDRLADECIESVYDLYVRGRTGRLLGDDFLMVHDLAATEPWSHLAALNTPGTLPPAIPVFIAQGTSDPIVPPRITRDYVRRLCTAGSRVTLDEMQGVGHGFAAMRSARTAVDWIADRFTLRPVPNDC